MIVNDLDKITEIIIGCSIEVHKNLGPGLLESIYEDALCHEFDLQRVSYKRQFQIPVVYKGKYLSDYRLDLLVENDVIVELKAVNKIEPVFEAQLLSYLKMADKKIGLLLNFNVTVLKNGIKRMIL